MENFGFPDIPTDLYQKSPVSTKKASTVWTEAELKSWLASPTLAEWVPDWMKSLRKPFGEALPHLMGKGLHFSREIPRWMTNDSPEPRWLQQFLTHQAAAETWFNSGFLQDDPAWLKQLIEYEKAQVARSFLLSGNISDYAFDPVYGYRPTIRLLVDTLMRTKDCVLTYRLSQGLNVHSQDNEIIDKLPKSVQSELEAEGFSSESSLLTEVCRLFDILSAWLMGKETDGDEFPRGVAIIFENVHLLIPSNRDDIERNFLVDSLLHWSSSPKLFHSSHCLILMAEALEDVGNELRARGGKIEQITILRPETVNARLKFLLPILDPQAQMRETRVAQLSRGLILDGYTGDYLSQLQQLSHDTAGLTLLGIEDLLQQASMRPDRRLSRDTVMSLKRERLSQESDGLLDVIDPRQTLEAIGGYPALKERLREVIVALGASHNELLRSTVPMGILFLGPPGTGKSIMAEALAGESNISMAKLGNFRGMYVGQSERNLSRIFSLIESLHPVIVFIDEIDQALGQRSAAAGDSGVDSRIFGRFLEFISKTEHRGKILWIGASNFPDKIDSAMKRAGRFDLVLPFLLPDQQSRKSILKVLLEGELEGISDVKHSLTDTDFEQLAAQTEGFSGAELRAIVGEVLRRVAQQQVSLQGTIEIKVDIFKQVLSVYLPPAEQRRRYLEMELLAIEEVSFMDLLPEKHQNLRQKHLSANPPL
jgi:transitional endoplasmic reticulum ATPase